MANFLGFKQAFRATYENAENKAGYVWFVRESSADTYGDIYVGSRHYGHFGNEAEQISALSALIGTGFTSAYTVADAINALQGIDASGEVVWATKSGDVYTETEPEAQGAEQYLKISIGSSASYIPLDELVNLDNYYNKSEADAKFLTGFTEADPVFMASPASGITAQQIADWDAKVSNIKPDWDAAAGSDAEILNKPTIPDVSNFVTSAQVATQVEAYGYLTAYTESDPVFMASAASGIQDSDIAAWNAKSDFSGSYNDLTDKPNIPAAQVQADWNEADSTSMAYIANKPTIPQAITIEGDDVEE